LNFISLKKVIFTDIIDRLSRLIDKKYIHGFFWSFLSVFSSKGSTLIASFFIAQSLGKSNFGQFGLIQSTLAMFGAFAGLGISLTMTKFIAQNRSVNVDFVSELIRQYGLLINISGIFFSTTLFLLSSWLANDFFKAPELLILFRISSGIIFFDALPQQIYHVVTFSTFL
jgi:O-antigen/teichoic acid export membrane protein